MTNYLIRLVLCGIIIMLIPKFLPSINVASFIDGVIIAFVMSILNTFVKPVLKLISLPITILTLGIFSLVITVLMVYACDYLVDGFKVDGFISPLIFSIVLSIANSSLGLFKEKKK